MNTLIRTTLLTALGFFSCAIPASAEDRPDMGFFPFVKGRYWLYDGTVKFVKDGKSLEKKITGWKSEVVDTVEGKGFKAALLKGSPEDLAWYEEAKAPGDFMYLLIKDSEFIKVSDGSESFAKIKSAGQLPAGFSDQGEMIFKTSMKTGDRFGDPEQTKLGPRYCWVVSNILKQKLEPAVKGLRADQEFTTCLLTFITSPDRTQLNFTSGVGVTFYQYVHHGTAGDCEMRLVETGDKAVEPPKTDGPR